MNIKKDNKGFTLVEIVIVLAIAALILAAILFAVQGAQQSRRDAARRDAAGQIGALLEESAGNHNGVYPTQTQGAITGGTAAEFQSQVSSRTNTPDGGEYAVTFAGTFGSCPTGDAVVDTVQIAYNGRIWQACMGLQSRDWFRANN